MSVTASTASISTKDARKTFGTRKTPMVVSAAAKAYRKDMPFDERFSKPGTAEFVRTDSWVIIDPALTHDAIPDTATKGTLVRANTYNLKLGDRQDYLNPANCREIPDGKELTKKLKGYTEVPMAEVPFVVVAVSSEEQPTEQSTDEIPSGEQSAGEQSEQAESGEQTA